MSSCGNELLCLKEMADAMKRIQASDDNHVAVMLHSLHLTLLLVLICIMLYKLLRTTSRERNDLIVI